MAEIHDTSFILALEWYTISLQGTVGATKEFEACDGVGDKSEIDLSSS